MPVPWQAVPLPNLVTVVTNLWDEALFYYAVCRCAYARCCNVRQHRRIPPDHPIYVTAVCSVVARAVPASVNTRLPSPYSHLLLLFLFPVNLIPISHLPTVVIRHCVLRFLIALLLGRTLVGFNYCIIMCAVYVCCVGIYMY